MKKIVLVVLIVILCGCSNKSITISSDTLSITGEDSYIGYLVIPAIDMNLGFYDYDNPLNDVDKNIELIETGVDNTYLIAGHSGTGKLAFFNDLRYLSIGDQIILEFKGITYTYEVINISRVEKNGSISISGEEGMIYLTTCDQIVKGYQLTIQGKLINEQKN